MRSICQGDTGDTGDSVFGNSYMRMRQEKVMEIVGTASPVSPREVERVAVSRPQMWVLARAHMELVVVSCSPFSSRALFGMRSRRIGTVRVVTADNEPVLWRDVQLHRIQTARRAWHRDARVISLDAPPRSRTANAWSIEPRTTRQDRRPATSCYVSRTTPFLPACSILLAHSAGRDVITWRQRRTFTNTRMEDQLDD